MGGASGFEAIPSDVEGCMLESAIGPDVNLVVRPVDTICCECNGCWT